jgi:hypothetical protein
MNIEAKPGEVRGMAMKPCWTRLPMAPTPPTSNSSTRRSYERIRPPCPPSWRSFFRGCDDRRPSREKAAKGHPEWQKPLKHQNGERSPRSTATGPDAEKPVGEEGSRPPRPPRKGAGRSRSQQVQDSIRALMMIRAYRMRGHLPPTSTRSASKRERRSPNSTRRPTASPSRHTTADLHRQRARPRIRDHARDPRHPARTYCGIGVEFMHISESRTRSPGCRSASRAGQGNLFTPEGQARDPQEAGRGRRLREVPATSATPAPSASVSTAAKR